MKKYTYKRVISLGMTMCLLTCVTVCSSENDDYYGEEITYSEDWEYEEGAEETDETYETDQDWEGEMTEEEWQDESEDYSDGFPYEEEDLGVTLMLPEEYMNAQGIMYFDVTDLSEREGVYYAQMNYTGIPADEVGNYYFLDDNEELINLETGEVMSMAELTQVYSDDESEVTYFAEEELFDEDGAVDSSFTSDAPIGYEAGQQLQNFTATCIDGSSFDLASYRGKVVIINLWATYCGPCVQELPHFVELYHQHEGDIGMLAVHANLTTEDVSDFLDQKGWDIQFTVDDQDESLFRIVNGSLALPQTIVLNRRGEVIYNRTGSVTPQMLEELYRQAAE